MSDGSTHIVVSVDGDGIKLQNAEIKDAKISPIYVASSNIDAPDVRLFIKVKCPVTGEWRDTGFFYETVVKNGEAKQRYGIDCNHFVMDERV